MSDAQLDILRHSLGIQQKNGRWTTEYRNYYNTAPGCSGFFDVEHLVSLGLMEPCGHNYFCVTEAGRKVAMEGITQ